MTAIAAPSLHLQGGDDGSLEDASAVFAGLRPRLFGIAHRMLGNWAEAEDLVQDAWVRWQACDRGAVVNPTAFLVTVVTRLALNAAQSGRARHERPVDDLPRDHSRDAGDPPEVVVERTEALERGLGLLIERLSPAERTAYVLRVAFDYPYARIARILRSTEVNARQLVSRATKHLAAGGRSPARCAEHRVLAHAFLTAARTGDLAGFELALSGCPRSPAGQTTATCATGGRGR
jgi:RNA polymerase sigma-70 factor (ECF subfamily)